MDHARASRVRSASSLSPFFFSCALHPIYTKRFLNDSIRFVRSCELSIWREEGKHQRKKNLNCWRLHGWIRTLYAHNQLAHLFPFGRLAARLAARSLLLHRRRRSRCKPPRLWHDLLQPPLPTKPPALFSLSSRQRSKSKSHAPSARGEFQTLCIYRQDEVLDQFVSNFKTNRRFSISPANFSSLLGSTTGILVKS
jgi:hypothetical protein